jgi:hypothetical protein
VIILRSNTYYFKKIFENIFFTTRAIVKDTIFKLKM